MEEDEAENCEAIQESELDAIENTAPVVVDFVVLVDGEGDVDDEEEEAGGEEGVVPLLLL